MIGCKVQSLHVQSVVTVQLQKSFHEADQIYLLYTVHNKERQWEFSKSSAQNKANWSSKLPRYSDLLAELSKFQHHTQLCFKCSIILVSSSNLSPIFLLNTIFAMTILDSISHVHLASFDISYPKFHYHIHNSQQQIPVLTKQIQFSSFYHISSPSILIIPFHTQDPYFTWQVPIITSHHHS